MHGLRPVIVLLSFGLVFFGCERDGMISVTDPGAPLDNSLITSPNTIKPDVIPAGCGRPDQAIIPSDQEFTLIIGQSRTGEICGVAPDGPTVVPSGLDLVFILDTTGSMSAPSVNVLNQLDQIASSVAALTPNVQYGLVTFRDYTGGLNYSFRVDSQLSSNIENLRTSLASQTFGGGGDAPESAIEGLYQGSRLNRISWRETSSKVVVLITDNPFKVPPAGYASFEAMVDSLNERNIKVVGINVDRRARAHMESLAEATDSKSLEGIDLNSDGDVTDSVDIAPGGALVFNVDASGNPTAGSTADIARAIVNGVTDIFYNASIEVSVNADAFGMVSFPVQNKTVPGGQRVCFDFHVTGKMASECFRKVAGFEIVMRKTGALDLIETEKITVIAPRVE